MFEGDYSPAMHGAVLPAPMSPAQGLSKGSQFIAPFLTGSESPVQDLAMQLLGSQSNLGIRPGLLRSMLSGLGRDPQEEGGVRSEAAQSLSAGSGNPLATRHRLMGYSGVGGPSQYGTFSRLGLGGEGLS